MSQHDANKPQQQRPALITLVAVERGFVDGAMVEPGEEFQFRTTRRDKDGKEIPRKLPKWAAERGDPRLVKKKAVWDGNLKPKPAQQASKEKREKLDNDLVG